MEEINELIGDAKFLRRKLEITKKAYEASILQTKNELAELELEIENRLLALDDCSSNACVFKNGTAGWSQAHVVVMPERIADLPQSAFHYFGNLMKHHPATFQLKVLPGAYAKFLAKEPDAAIVLQDLGFVLDKTNKFYIS